MHLEEWAQSTVKMEPSLRDTAERCHEVMVTLREHYEFLESRLAFT